MTEPIPAPTGTPNLNKALAAFQAEMPTLERDREVEVETKGDKPNYGYSYATLANVTRVAMPLLGKHGLSFTAFPGTGADGKFSLTYSLLHESGEERSGMFPLSAEGGIQVLGGRITYARRYCLISVTGLAADEDDDAAAAQAVDDANAGTAQRRKPPAATKSAPPARRSAPESAPEPGAPAATAQRAQRPAGPALPGEDGGVVRGRGGLITEPMTRKLAITMKEVVGDNGDDRRQFVIDMVGREVASTKDLTFDEGRALIDAFEKAKATDNPLLNVIDIYQRTTAEAAPARTSTQSAPAARPSVREQTRNAVLGQPAGPDDEPPPWDEPSGEDVDTSWPEAAQPGGAR